MKTKPPGLSEQLEASREATRRMKLRYDTLFGAVLERINFAGVKQCSGCPVPVAFCMKRREGERCATTLRAWIETEVGR